jgi:hypothetical protein
MERTTLILLVFYPNPWYLDLGMDYVRILKDCEATEPCQGETIGQKKANVA